MDQEGPKEPGKSLFERHPRKTLAAMVALAILVLALVADRLAALKSEAQGPSIKRYIRLRELDPLSFEVVRPDPQAFDTEAGSQPRPVVLRVDRHGFIIPSHIHASPELILVFLGGSTTECRAIPEESRFPYLVGRHLESAFQLRVNSYNGARSGNNSLHSLDILLNKVMPLNPDLVVVMHNINDLITLMYEKTYWNTNPNRRVIVEMQPTLTGSVREFFGVLREYTVPNLYRGLKDLERRARGQDQAIDEFQHVRGQKVEIDRAYLLKEFRGNLQMFVDLCRARQISPVLMTQANRLVENLDPKTWKDMQVLAAQGIRYQDFREIFGLFNQAVRDLGAANGATVVDLAREIPPEEAYVYDPVHLTERASKRAARIISREVEPLVQARLKARGAKSVGGGGQGPRAPAPAPKPPPPTPKGD